MVAIELEAVDERECRIRSLDLGDGDGAVERDDRARGDRLELVVELQDLPPVRRGRISCVGVHRVDRRLDLVWTGLVALEALPDDGLPFGEEVTVPDGAVLVSEQDQVAVRRRAGGSPRPDQQHERKQAHALRFVGHELHQETSEPDGLRAELLTDQALPRTRRVTLVEDEIDDGQDGPNPAREIGLVRDAVRDARIADLALGTDQSLSHRRFGDQEGARDLGGGEPSQESERQGNLHADGERRVATGEDQAQPVIAHDALLGRFALGMQQDGLGVTVLAGRLPAKAIDRPVAGGGDDPARRTGRQSTGWPSLHRRREGVLDRLLGNVDVAEDANQHGHRASVLFTEYTFNLRGRKGLPASDQSSLSSWNGRTSIGRVTARASLRPQSSAASRSGALMMQIPPICSLPSA